MSDRSRNFLEWREIDTNWILFLLLLDFFQILIELCGLIVVKGLNWMDVEKPENPRNMPVLQEEEKFCYQRYPFILSTCLSLVTGMSILKIRKILQKIWILHSGLKANFKRFWKKKYSKWSKINEKSGFLRQKSNVKFNLFSWNEFDDQKLIFAIVCKWDFLKWFSSFVNEVIFSSKARCATRNTQYASNADCKFH